MLLRKQSSGYCQKEEIHGVFKKKEYMMYSTHVLYLFDSDDDDYYYCKLLFTDVEVSSGGYLLSHEAAK